MKNINSTKILFYAVAGVFLLISAFLHFWRIGEHPPGLHVDEGSIAFNALCIADTGKDEHGAVCPVFFKCFGDYKNPVSIYVLVPIVKVFGYSKVALRFPSAFFLILASIAVFFLSKKYCRNNWIALASAFVFSLLPWAFPISRINICGFTVMLLCLAAGMTLLFKAISRESYPLAMLSGLIFAISMCSTHSGRPVSAIILICYTLAFCFSIYKRWRPFFVFTVALFLFMLPVIIYVLGNYSAITSRFNEISVWKDNPTLVECISMIVIRYMEYFGPAFLFVTGDPNITHSTGQAGELYLFLIPFIIAGLWTCIRYFKKNPYYRFLLGSIVTYPVAAALTIGHGHSTCCISGSIFWLLLSALGARLLWERRKKFMVLIIITLILAVYEVPAYMCDYFNRYFKASRAVFSAPQMEALQKALEHLGKGETLYVSRYIFFPEIIKEDFASPFHTGFIFFAGITPAEYFKAGGIPRDSICLYDGKINREGILLRLDGLLLPDESGKIFLRHDYDPSEGIPQGAVLIDKIPTPSGICFEIYKVKGAEK